MSRQISFIRPNDLAMTSLARNALAKQPAVSTRRISNSSFQPVSSLSVFVLIQAKDPCGLVLVRVGSAQMPYA